MKQFRLTTADQQMILEALEEYAITLCRRAGEASDLNELRHRKFWEQEMERVNELADKILEQAR